MRLLLSQQKPTDRAGSAGHQLSHSSDKLLQEASPSILVGDCARISTGSSLLRAAWPRAAIRRPRTGRRPLPKVLPARAAAGESASGPLSSRSAAGSTSVIPSRLSPHPRDGTDAGPSTPFSQPNGPSAIRNANQRCSHCCFGRALSSRTAVGPTSVTGYCRNTSFEITLPNESSRTIIPGHPRHGGRVSKSAADPFRTLRQLRVTFSSFNSNCHQDETPAPANRTRTRQPPA